MNEITPRKLTPKKILVGIIFLVAFAFLFSVFQSTMSSHAGVSAMGDNLAVYSEPSMGMRGMPSARARMVTSKGMAVETQVAEDAGYAVPPTMPSESAAPAGTSKIVKNGDLSLLVESVEEAGVQINTLRTTLLGQPGNANFSEYGAGKAGDVTIWVPADRFDEAMVSLKKLALKVENERISVQDVSAQYVDLEARLKSLKAAEAQYLILLKQSGKVSEILEVTRTLNNTRTQIEQTQGQMNYLSRQISLSAIHISLREDAVPGQVVSHEWRPMSVVKAALKSTLSDSTAAIDGLLILLIRLPLLLIELAFLSLIFWGVYRVGKLIYVRATTSGGKGMLNK